MACIDAARQDPAAKSAGVAIDIQSARSARSRVELRLQCVSSGYLSGNCSCPCTIPAGAVLAAWARELEKAAGERFFHFTWGGGEWLAYGLEDGLVRGVYCPDHSAERDERSFSYGSRSNAAMPQLAASV
jgi:hypothetical protein